MENQTDNIEKSTLPVMEDFYSVQGEGFHQGRAAYFVRLGGCDVGCVWCDVKESWDKDAHPKLSTQEIIDRIQQSETDFVVVTGGEPLMHDCQNLTTALRNKKYELAIETSGAYPITGAWDWICVSPKKFKAPLPEVLAEAHELKVVVYNKSDFAWAEEHRALVNKNCKLFLQPEWSKEKEMSQLIVDYVKEHPEWNISLQIHKYLDLR